MANVDHVAWLPLRTQVWVTESHRRDLLCQMSLRFNTGVACSASLLWHANVQTVRCDRSDSKIYEACSWVLFNHSIPNAAQCKCLTFTSKKFCQAFSQRICLLSITVSLYNSVDSSLNDLRLEPIYWLVSSFMPLDSAFQHKLRGIPDSCQLTQRAAYICRRGFQEEDFHFKWRHLADQEW